MQAYLFVHFKEKITPDGEQVYFALSKDGMRWEELNEGLPILWSYYGDRGVRDFTIIKNDINGKYYIFATDLSLSYGMKNQYQNSWKNIAEKGSSYLSVWESNNLVDWSEQKLVRLGDENFGCLWAPDIIYDKEHGDFVIHWSSSHRENAYGPKKIYYSRTKDFESFTKPDILYWKEDSGIIDSAIYEEDGKYYMFVKSEQNPAKIIMLSAEHVTGPYTRVEQFDRSMADLETGKYEAPTAVKLEDGRWCLFLDYYGQSGPNQGYVPFVANSLAEANFVRSDEEFSFPYKFKHGTILTITKEDYERMKAYDWRSYWYAE